MIFCASTLAIWYCVISWLNCSTFSLNLFPSAADHRRFPGKHDRLLYVFTYHGKVRDEKGASGSSTGLVFSSCHDSVPGLTAVNSRTGQFDF